MIEAHIICCNPCDIPDLGIVGLRRGEQRWVSDAAALASKDLRKEQAKGNVRVSRKPRRGNTNTPRRPPPPFVAQSRHQNNTQPENKQPEKIVEKHVETVIEKTVVQEVDTAKLKQELLGDLIPGIREAIAAEVGKAVAQNTPQAPQEAAPSPATLDAAQLEGVLESVLRRVVPAGGVAPSGGGGRSRTAGPEEPLYIPSQIVAKDTKAKIDVNQKADDNAGDLDDAQAALRALKRKKRGRKKEENS